MQTRTNSLQYPELSSTCMSRRIEDRVRHDGLRTPVTRCSWQSLQSRTYHSEIGKRPKKDLPNIPGWGGKGSPAAWWFRHSQWVSREAPYPGFPAAKRFRTVKS